ncbi:hypothetical protein DV701_17660 [Ornithinimicrobium avium]|uniref:Uncharacterized protein n=1 Tax=Ornithinimicrobium avium TaxID=2283195 RepID=A0A345NRN2_9MICO|nr:hypothetical protein DV701_17660 [Ornithinimicrobium avium]
MYVYTHVRVDGLTPRPTRRPTTPAEVVSKLRAVYDAFEVEVTERAEGHGFHDGVPGVGLRGAEGELATALPEMM